MGSQPSNWSQSHIRHDPQNSHFPILNFHLSPQLIPAWRNSKERVFFLLPRAIFSTVQWVYNQNQDTGEVNSCQRGSCHWRKVSFQLILWDMQSRGYSLECSGVECFFLFMSLERLTYNRNNFLHSMHTTQFLNWMYFCVF